MANAKTAATVFGILFIIVGVLGFVPNPIVSLTGIFQVNDYHNIFHIGAGIVLLLGAYASAGAFGPGLALRFVGAVYAILAVLGFLIPGNTIFDALAMNMADHWLHAVLAVILLLLGFVLAPATRTANA
jgi:hypothetical protein